MIFHCVERSAHVWERFEASEFDRLSRKHLLDLLPLIVYEEAHFALVSPAHEHILLFQSALFNEHSGCDLCCLVIKVGFDNETLSFRVEIFIEIELCVGYLYYFLFKEV